ncbi:MAG: BON domain-containing protein [Phycisphaerales bacterium]
MNIRNYLLAGSIVVAAGAMTACERNNGTGSRDGTTNTAPDNTARNRNDPGKTPMDQSNTSDNTEISAAVRRAILDDPAMSVNAQNVKVVTDKAGVVTLRGVVETQAEKESIGAKAESVAGVTRVDNQLEVKSK